MDRDRQSRGHHSQAERSQLWTSASALSPVPTTHWCSGREQSCIPAWGVWMGTCPSLASVAFQVSPGTRISWQPLGQHATSTCLGDPQRLPVCSHTSSPLPISCLEFWSWLQQHDFCPLRSLLGRLAKPAAATHNQLLGPRTVRQLSVRVATLPTRVHQRTHTCTHTV